MIVGGKRRLWRSRSRVESRYNDGTDSSLPVHPAIVVRQRKAWRRRDGVFLYFEGAFFFSFLFLLRVLTLPS